MAWSQEAWERKEIPIVAALTGKMELNMETGRVRRKREREEKKRKRKKTKRIHSHFNSIWLKQAFSTQSFMYGYGGQQTKPPPNGEH